MLRFHHNMIYDREKICYDFHGKKSFFKTHLDVDDVLISGHDKRRLQNANGGLSIGVVG